MLNRTIIFRIAIYDNHTYNSMQLQVGVGLDTLQSFGHLGVVWRHSPPPLFRATSLISEEYFVGAFFATYFKHSHSCYLSTMHLFLPVVLTVTCLQTCNLHSYLL